MKLGLASIFKLVISSKYIITLILLLTSLVALSQTPAIDMVTSLTGDGTYKIGDIIIIRVTYDADVDVDMTTGTINLTLETGSTDRDASYTGGTQNDVTILHFTYTVLAGDESSDLDQKSGSSLSLNGGATIKKAGTGVDAEILLPGSPDNLASNQNIVVDGIVPNAPSTPNMTSGTDSNINNDNITNDNTPRFTGSGVNGETIDLISSVDGNVGSVVVSGGSWSITASTLAEGGHDMTARATDVAGNIGPESSALAITIDTIDPTAPSTPDLTSGTDSNINNDNITNDDTPTFVNSADDSGSNGETVQIVSSIDGNVGSNAISGGNWSVDVSSLGDGNHNITAQIADIAGNVGESSPLAVTIDTSNPSAPAAPDMTPGTDSNINNDNITNNITPDFTGSGTNGETINLISSVDGNVGSIIVSGGSWTITASTLATGGHNMTATSTDVAGNLGSASSPLNITIDISRPSFSSGLVSDGAKNNIVAIFNSNITLSDATGFSVAGTSAGPIISVSGSGTNTLTFTLSGNVISSDAITLIYDGSNNATDVAGNSLNSFSSAITNNVKPAYANAVVQNANPDKLIASFSEVISLSSSAGFSVSGTTGNITSVSGTGTSTLTFTLDQNVRSTDIILFSYSPGNAQGSTGVALASFNNEAVTNNVDPIPEPQDHVSSFTATAATTTSINLTWTESANPQLPENYLIVGRDALSGSFASVTDTNPVADDSNWGNGNFAKNVSVGTSNLMVSGLVSGRNYIFRIYPYTNILSNIDFKTSATVPQDNATLNVGAETIITGGSGVATMSSVIDTKGEALAAAGNFTFTIDDDGASNSIDTAPTLIDGITIRRDAVNDETGDWTNAIAGIVLKDNGSGTLNSADNPGSFSITADAIIITGIPNASTSDLGFVADDGTKNYSLVVWLRTDLVSTGLEIDNKKLAFTIADVDITVETVTEPLSSTLATSSAASGNSNNVIEVTATELYWKSLTGISTAHTNFTVVVQATDENKNRDYNKTGLVVMDDTTAPSGGYFESEGQPNDTDEDLVQGQFTRTDMQVHTLGTYVFEATLSGLTTGVTGPHVFIAGNAQSDIVITSFNPTDNINYILFQESPINGDGTGDIKVAEFEVRDGGTLLPANDSDDAATGLTDITFSLSNFANIRQVALHDGSSIVESKAAAASITFADILTISADDDGTAIFSLYVSFKSGVTDNENFQLQITNAVASGSTFATSDAGGVASPLAGDDNRIEVTATQLDFHSTPLNSVQGINTPILPAQPQVFANDANGSLDVDFSSSAVVTSPASNTNIPAAFGNVSPGVLDFPSFQYTGAGFGTISVSAGGLNGSSNTIDVIHVAAVTADTGAPQNTPAGGNNGISTEDPIFGGSINRVIFGATFNASHTKTGEPVLQDITVNFGNPISSVLDNIRVFKSANNIFDGGDLNISGLIDLQSDHINIVGINHDLSISSSVTIFVMVDINVAVGGSTPPISPSLTSIMTSAFASSAGNFTARTYNFRDFFQPFLVNRSPAIGEENFGLGADIQLEFNEIVSTTDSISVFELDGTLVRNIKLRNPDPLTGSIFNFPTNEVDPITGLDLPGPINILSSDTWYYITVRQGTDSTGFIDTSNNPFDSIPALTWKFKTSDLTPPELVVGMPTSMTNISLLGGNLKVAINEKGKVYYLVISDNPLLTDPVASQIIDPATYTGEILAGSIDIVQDSTYHYAPVFDGTFVNGTTYEVHYIAIDNSNPANIMVSTKVETFVATNPAGSGLILSALAKNLCQGTAQILFPPLNIVERNTGDFPNSSNQTFNLALPLGYEFNLSAANASATYQSGGNVTSANLNYINNTLLEVKFSTSGTNRIDMLIISGLEVSANGAVGNGGDIIRSGGNALLTKLPDGTALGSLNTFAIPEVTFSTDPNTTIIGNNVPEVLLIPNVPLSDQGLNVFSGDGVIGDVMFTNATTIGSHIITLTHTTQEGCASNSDKTIEIFDNDGAIGGLVTIYCTDEADARITFNGKFPDYTLVSVDIDLPESVLLDNPDTISSPYYNIILPASLTGPIVGDYIFQPSALATPTIEAKFGAEGGYLGDVFFSADYIDILTLDTVTFKQQVQIFIPPTTSIKLDGVIPIDPLIEYCEDNSLIQLSGFPAPSTDISEGFFVVSMLARNKVNIVDTWLNDSGDGNATLDMQELSDSLGFGEFEIKYIFEKLSSGCNDTISQKIRINPKPRADYIIPSIICEDTELNFSDITAYLPADLNTIQSNNDSLRVNGDTLAVSFAISPPITKWTWDFDDAANSGPGNQNTSVDSATVHTFKDASIYNVSLIVETDFGCVSDTSRSLVIGGLPSASFDMAGTSLNEEYKFTSTSDVLREIGEFDHAIDSVAWDIDGDGLYDIGSNDNDTTANNIASFNYSYADSLSFGIYNINFTAIASTGCSTTISPSLVVLPNVLADSTAANSYKETFSTDDGNWVSLPEIGVNNDTSSISWAWGAPNKPVIIPSLEQGSNVWVTGLTTQYDSAEQSYVYSPAFDLRNLARPMIQLDIFKDLEEQDGVIFEYSTDSFNIMDGRKIWLALGVKDEGIEWFDANGLAGSPGNDATGLGWTATSADTSWVTAKHSLGEVYAGNFTPEKIDSIKSRVLFRVGLGAIASASPLKTRDGFAFDNVFIGNRTRTVLLENFTSMAQGANTKFENEAINTLAKGTDGTELIVLTYHTSFTGDDLLNQDNPSEPGARALHYGISTSPRVAIDGSTGPEGSTNNSNLLFTDWGETFYSKRTLQLAPFEISLELDRDNINDGKVRIFANITAKEDIDTSFVVHVAVVEKEILPGQIGISGLPVSGEDIFYNTLRKMLPNAAGTRFIGSKVQGSQISVNETWDPTNVVDPDGTAILQVIVFIQDEVTQEILQAASINFTEDLVLALEQELSDKGVALYPNPADRQLTIKLSEELYKDGKAIIFDNTGKQIEEIGLQTGQDLIELNTMSYRPGIYLFTLPTETGAITKRFVIRRR